MPGLGFLCVLMSMPSEHYLHAFVALGLPRASPFSSWGAFEPPLFQCTSYALPVKQHLTGHRESHTTVSFLEVVLHRDN